MVEAEKKTRWKDILTNIEIEFRVGSKNKAFTALCDLTAKIIESLPEPEKKKVDVPMPPPPTDPGEFREEE